MEISSRKGTDNYNKAKQQIIQREKDIKETATQDAEVLYRELDILLKPQNDTLHNTKETLRTNVSYLKETTNLIDKVLHSNDVKFVLDTSISIEKEFPSKDIEGLNVSLKSPVDLIVPVLSLRFGSLVVPKLAIIQSVQTPLKTVKCLESLDNGLEKAVNGLSSSFSVQWTYIGNRSVNINNDFKPKDIVISSSGLIYVTDDSTSSIHVLTQDGDFVANYGKEHDIIDPEVLHINKEGQLMIWCRDGKIHVADISS
ncbi:unnamed protein product [Mytilus edulis]|uniref:Uncharacterized protein n=1 Tax=Mytilus edulis TaxID=6550 RepID=A0A8S3T102_MYTED|nr:unnamed protein product [Mytilus edulis]